MDSDRAELHGVVHLLAIEMKHLLLQRHSSLSTQRDIETNNVRSNQPM
jgi:hypothetical protein